MNTTKRKKLGRKPIEDRKKVNRNRLITMDDYTFELLGKLAGLSTGGNKSKFIRNLIHYYVVPHTNK